ncbi:hypothetical protein MXB_4592 [Myxobolus squamalis]|nr:hypothetical protein MXB_4592 [Myxobolus squamalis]
MSTCVALLVDEARTHGQKKEKDDESDVDMVEEAKYLEKLHFEDFETLYHTAHVGSIASEEDIDLNTFLVNKNENYDTMIVNEQSTVIDSVRTKLKKPILKDDSNGKEKGFVLEDEIMLNIPFDSKGSVDIEALAQLSLLDLVKRLENADLDKEQDINKIKKYYTEKRQPIIEAILHKSSKI